MTGIICWWRSWDKHYCRRGHCCWPYACLRASSAPIPSWDSSRKFSFCPETRSQSCPQLSLVHVCGFQSHKDFHTQFVGQQSWLPLIKYTWLNLEKFMDFYYIDHKETKISPDITVLPSPRRILEVIPCSPWPKTDVAQHCTEMRARKGVGSQPVPAGQSASWGARTWWG